MRLLTLLATATALMASSVSYAVNYDLTTDKATLFGGNLTSTFYEVSGSGTDSGTASGLYSALLGGSADTGFWVKILFGVNPQPVLTSAFLKAANSFLLWDADDLAEFNAGVYDSITLWNQGDGGIKNTNNKYQGTSHAGLNGTTGVTVPDSASTLALLGIGLASLGLMARKRKA